MASYSEMQRTIRRINERTEPVGDVDSFRGLLTVLGHRSDTRD